MDLMSFATGLAIGKKKYGGGGGNSIFQDILNNSVQLNTITVDSVYKWTLNVWYTDRFEFHGFFAPGSFNYDQENGSNGKASFIFPVHKWTIFFRIAWENNVPLFALCSYGGLDKYDEYAAVPVGSSSSNFEWYRCKTVEYVVDETSYTPYIGTALKISTSNLSNMMYFTYTGMPTVSLIKNEYGIRKQTISDIPEVFLNKSSSETVEISPSNTCLYPTNEIPIFSDMTQAEVYSKFEDIFIAALAANNIPARKSIIVSPT